MRKISLATIGLVLSTSAAYAENDNQETHRVEYDQANGTAKVIRNLPSEEDVADMRASGLPGEKFLENGLSWGAIADQGIAYYDKSGKLLEVFPSPKTPEEQAFVIDKLNLGGGRLQTVSLFSKQPSLPTSEEVRRITEDAINAALVTVCNINPRPEKLNLNVSLEAGLGLSGKFTLQLDWMPRRDCK